ncbi:MAG: hypothetical protein ACRES7_00745 [Gammaproteobacteria bacterium]
MFVGVVMPGFAAAAAQQNCAQVVDLRDLMTVATFNQAGLNQLDHDQLASLNDWLDHNAWSLCPTPATDSSTGALRACPQPIDLRDFMTVSVFDQSGLSKLDPDQLAALNAWLRGNVRDLCAASAPTTPPVALPLQPSPGALSTPGSTSTAVEAFGAPPVRTQEPKRIESRIDGDFHGWSGDTIFRLENGQIWKQAGPGYFQIDLRNPEIVIKKLLIGYVLVVSGYGSKEVFVRRIR